MTLFWRSKIFRLLLGRHQGDLLEDIGGRRFLGNEPKLQTHDSPPSWDPLVRRAGRGEVRPGSTSAGPGPKKVLWLLGDYGADSRVVDIDVNLGAVDNRPVRGNQGRLPGDEFPFFFEGDDLPDQDPVAAAEIALGPG